MVRAAPNGGRVGWAAPQNWGREPGLPGPPAEASGRFGDASNDDGLLLKNWTRTEFRELGISNVWMAGLPAEAMALDRVAGEVSEELRASFESWTETTLLRQHPSTDCVYRPTSMRAKILRELPRRGSDGAALEFTYAQLMETVAKLGGSMRDVTIMATHLNHQTILAVGQPRIHDKRLRNGPPPVVTPPKRRRTDAPPPPEAIDDDDDDRTADHVSAQEVEAAELEVLAAEAALAAARANRASKKRGRRETIEREIERLQAARDALESDAE